KGTHEAQSTTAEVFKTLDKSASRTEKWVEKNQKYVFGAIAIIGVAVLGYLAYREFIQKPKEIEASDEMFFAQQYMDQAQDNPEKDSLYNLALNGAEGKYGLLDIIANYKGTKAANLAQYSAGMAYLNLHSYEEAITRLQRFSSDDAMLGALAKGGIGDAFMQLNQPEDALAYYESAFNYHTNNYLTPRFLFKAGATAMALKQYDKALTYFKRIREEFPDSEEGRTIDVYIGYAENVK
ncbi:MAG: tetratricopeptide repeat protein, partial [Sinomicrobium sp.]|nr:tetratricopeptide repeat protein [Sinomicrobium sp.]